MSKISGKGGQVYYNNLVIANITEWAMSGFTMGTIKKDPAFGDSITEYVSDGVGDPGTISFSGNYDPAAASNQALQVICAAGTGLYGLYLYAANATWWHVGTGGEIIVTKADAITLPRSGMGKISFEGRVSGAALVQVGTGS